MNALKFSQTQSFRWCTTNSLKSVWNANDNAKNNPLIVRNGYTSSKWFVCTYTHSHICGWAWLSSQACFVYTVCCHIADDFMFAMKERYDHKTWQHGTGLSQLVTEQQLHKVKTKGKNNTHTHRNTHTHTTASPHFSYNEKIMRQKSEAVKRNTKCAINTHHAKLWNIIGLKLS